MTRLIANADDLGLHPRIDEGIFRAHEKGIVTSATVLVTGRTAPQAIARAKEVGLGLGVHLCLSTGLSPAASPHQVRWVAPGGRFRRNWATFARDYALGQVPMEEIARELQAQVALAKTLGMQPDHLDGHQHLHVLPGVARVVEQIAREERLPLRWPQEKPSLGWIQQAAGGGKSALLKMLAAVPGGLEVVRVPAVGMFEAGRLFERTLLLLLDGLPDGVVELGCHPGLDPGVVPEDPEWRYGWEGELDALTSPVVRERIRARRIELTTYGKVFGEAA